MKTKTKDKPGLNLHLPLDVPEVEQPPGQPAQPAAGQKRRATSGNKAKKKIKNVKNDQKSPKNEAVESSVPAISKQGKGNGKAKLAGTSTDNHAPVKREIGPYHQYSEGLAEEICVRLENGETLSKICRSEHMPNRSSVLRWLDLHSEFATEYARARSRQVESWVDEMVDIADDWKGDPDSTSRRLRVSARQWIAGKIKPQKYGDAQDDKVASVPQILIAIPGGSAPIEHAGDAILIDNHQTVEE